MAEASPPVDKLKPLVQAAYEGKLTWLHELLVAVGYVADTDAARWSMSRKQVADLIGKTPRTISRWCKSRGFPECDEATRRWDVRAVVAWCFATTDAAAEEVDPEKAARIKKLEAQTRKAELETAALEGELVDADARLQMELEALVEFKGALQGLPSLATDDALRERLEERVREILGELEAKFAGA